MDDTPCKFWVGILRIETEESLDNLKPVRWMAFVCMLALLGCGDAGGNGSGGDGTGGSSDAKNLELEVPDNQTWGYIYRAGPDSDLKADGRQLGKSVAMTTEDGKWTGLELTNSVKFEFDGGIPAQPGSYETTYATTEWITFGGAYNRYSFLAGAPIGSSDDPVGEALNLKVDEVDDGQIVRGEIWGEFTHADERDEDEVQEVSPPLLFRAVIDDQ